MDARYRQSFATMLKLVGAAYRAGVVVESSTDALAGFSLLRELELHVQAGIPRRGGPARRHPGRGADHEARPRPGSRRGSLPGAFAYADLYSFRRL